MNTRKAKNSKQKIIKKLTRRADDDKNAKFGINHDLIINIC